LALTPEEVCAEVLERITPSRKERAHILRLAEDLRRRVEEAAEEKGIGAEARVEGSVAKDTWLREEPDIDIFLRLPLTLSREALGAVGLEIARRATRGFKQVERFAEHPYLECFVDDVRVNIVPCYRVEGGRWLSATDRTPFHTDYVKPLLNERLVGEIRLLKRFMKGVGVYGAEIRIGGFSGYLCELLILQHGSFMENLKSAADWRRQEVIDYGGHYKGRQAELRKVFGDDPLVVIDPVDKGRNVAAAVREERLNEFMAAARSFMEKPSSNFFYPPAVKAFKADQLVNAIRARGSTLLFLRFGSVGAVPDVLWGQLYRTQKALGKMLQRFDFKILRDTVWSNEGDVNVFIFELETRLLPPIRRHLGPPLEKRMESEKFLKKHLGVESTVSGPRVEGNRWVVETRRKYVDAVELLKEKLRDDGRSVGVADLLSQTIAKSFQVLVNEEILPLYSSNGEFAKFLTEYLKGRPRWLD